MLKLDKFLKDNGITLDTTKDDLIQFGFDTELKVVYVSYAPDGQPIREIMFDNPGLQNSMMA